jgi:hypothetical protein
MDTSKEPPVCFHVFTAGGYPFLSLTLLVATALAAIPRMCPLKKRLKFTALMKVPRTVP